MPKITERLSALTRRKLAQARLAREWGYIDAAKACGVSYWTYTRWERGESTPSALALPRLREVFAEAFR